MKKIIAVIIFILLSLPAHGADPLTKTDLVLELVFIGLYTVDWGQTLDITRCEDEGYYEVNPIIGRHPSRRRVNTVFTLFGVGQIAGTILLPTRSQALGHTINPRRIWQLSFITVSATCVVNNFNIGLKVTF